MLLLFRLLKIRFIGAFVVIGLIATGNGDAVFAAAHAGLTATAKAVEVVEGLYKVTVTSAGADSTTGKNTEGGTSKSGKGPSEGKQSKGTPGAFKVTLTDNGTPVRWCAKTIDVVVNDSQAPAGARADLEEALRRVSALSGVNFDVVGDSNLIPDSRYHLRTGNPYPPVLVAWVNPSQTDVLDGNASAVATSNPISEDGKRRYVTGALAINVDHDVLYRPGFGSGMTRGNLYMHELGHILGLAHVDDADMLMNPIIGANSPDGFANGDRRGLLALTCR